ncbi:MAG: hypothetical protein QF464_23190, partial [Myxococcota bacterium]|nr:hypothetical protein [Myxococcota bacterium]
MNRVIRSLLMTTLLVVGCGAPGSDVPGGSDDTCTVGAACDDADLSTRDDTCREDGTCAGVAIVCPEHACLLKATPNGVDCDLTMQPDGAVCDDGSVCTDGDRCIEGSCRAGEPMICDDHDPCTEDACDPA